MSDPVRVDLHGFAHGGEAVGRLPDGRAVFVALGIPGETVTVVVTEEHKRWARARLVDIVVASPDRVQPPCPYFGPGQCGGCRLQHIAGDRQHALLRQVVVDQLERLGKLPDPPVAPMVGAGSYGYRNRARFGVTASGFLGYRRAGTNDVMPIDRCLLLDDPTQQVRDAIGDGHGGVTEVEVRTGTAGAAAVADPSGAAQLLHGEGVVTEGIGDATFQVSPASFFQSNRLGAAILVDLVRSSAAVREGDTALDLYAGVGLFAWFLAADGATVTAVEGAPSAVADAQVNLAGRAEVISSPVGRVVTQLHTAERRFDVVVLDPPRSGAGGTVIEQVGALARRTIVVVACDPAALGRDAGILVRAGWRLVSAVPVDQFAQTGHLEVVATFERPAA